MTLPNDVVELSARALAIADGKDPEGAAWVQGYGNRAETFGVCWRDQFADKARAALEAARYGELVERLTALEFECRACLKPHQLEGNRSLGMALGNARALLSTIGAVPSSEGPTNPTGEAGAPNLSTIGEPTDIGATQP